MTGRGRAGTSAPEGFDALWQAELIALQTALVEAGHLGAQEWAETLSRQLHAADAAVDGRDYYPRFLKALEQLLESRRQVGQGEIADLAAAWRRAAQATPHGKPILLENDPEHAERDGAAGASAHA